MRRQIITTKKKEQKLVATFWNFIQIKLVFAVDIHTHTHHIICIHIYTVLYIYLIYFKVDLLSMFALLIRVEYITFIYTYRKANKNASSFDFTMHFRF